MYLDVQPSAEAPVLGAPGRWGWDVRLRDRLGVQLCDESAVLARSTKQPI